MGDRQDIHNSDVPVLCRSCEARHRGMCGALAPDELIKLAKQTHKTRHKVGLQFAPDFLGRLFGRESTVTAEAASTVELCVVPRPALERLMADSPALEHRLMQQTLRELDEARDWMVTLGRKTAQEKVASFLHLIASHGDPGPGAGPMAFDLPLTRADIADFLGLTIETVSRQLTRLRQMGAIVITNNRHVEISDLDELRALCG